MPPAPGAPKHPTSTIPQALAGRVVEHSSFVTVSGGELRDASGARVSVSIASNGEVVTREDSLAFRAAPDQAMLEVRILLPELVARGTGVGAEYWLTGWKNISYLALGYTHADGSFQHVKIPHPPLDGARRQSEVWSNDDLSRLISTSFSRAEPTAVKDVRIWARGTPDDEGGTLNLGWVGGWRGHTSASLRMREDIDIPSLSSAIVKHTESLGIASRDAAESNIVGSTFQVTDTVQLPWPDEGGLPEGLDGNVTWLYKFHSFHHVSQATLLFLNDSSRGDALDAALRWSLRWLSEGMTGPLPNMKYAWYEHGTAERLIALVHLDMILRQHRPDAAVSAELTAAIYAHALLLASDSFYVHDQPVRHHNHACFQDLALLLLAAVYETDAADVWQAKAVLRLEEQIDSLMPLESGMRVLVENSTGYQMALGAICELAAALLPDGTARSFLLDARTEAESFYDLVAYPDGRRPANGDSARASNSAPRNTRRWRIPTESPAARSIAPFFRSGYVVTRGQHRDTPYSLVLFATSLSATHKHEDHLSVTLHLDDVEWFTDPGFTSYEADDLPAAYLRGRWGHTAVAVPDLSYDLSPGTATIRTAEMTGRTSFDIHAEHTSYPGLVVSRSIAGSLSRLRLTFSDTISATDDAETLPTAYSVIHLGDGVEVHAMPRRLTLTHPHSRFALRISTRRGAGTPLITRGWRGDAMGSSVAARAFGVTEDTTSILLPLGGTPLTWTVSARRHRVRPLAPTTGPTP